MKPGLVAPRIWFPGSDDLSIDLGLWPSLHMSPFINLVGYLPARKLQTHRLCTVFHREVLDRMDAAISH